MNTDHFDSLDEVLEQVVNAQPVIPADYEAEPSRKAAASAARSKIAEAESQLAQRGAVEPERLAMIEGLARSALSDFKCDKCGREFGLLRARDYANIWRIQRIDEVAGVEVGVLRCGDCQE